MRIVEILLDDYIDSPFNPRIKFKEGDFAFDSLSKSIEEFKFLQPMIVNRRTHHIISGHLRKMVLLAKGITKAEAVIVDFDETKEKAAVIAFNKISGKWDEDKLAVLLEELQNIPDLDVTLTGFNLPEISEIMDNFYESKDGDDFDVNAAIDQIETPITQKGDLLILGRHRLLCGDSADPGDLVKLMKGEKAALLVSDPPYGISYYQDKNSRPQKNPRPKKCRRWGTIYNDGLNEEDYFKWIEQVFTNMDKHLASGAPIYVWNAHKQFYTMYHILQKLQYHIGCIITWGKESFTLGYGDYQQKTEFCLYGWKKENGAHRWYGPNNESTLWQVKRDPTHSYQHLTQKPVELSARAMRNSSLRDDVVLELFGGSGSTLIAAEQLNRKCYCMEIMPAFVDVIVKRYIAFVGEDKVSAEIKSKYLKEVRQ